MGKRNKRKGKRQPAAAASTNKRQKRNRQRYRRCWIEECPETEADSNYIADEQQPQVDMKILITRVLLFDKHSSSRVDSFTRESVSKEDDTEQKALEELEDSTRGVVVGSVAGYQEEDQESKLSVPSPPNNNAQNNCERNEAETVKPGDRNSDDRVEKVAAAPSAVGDNLNGPKLEESTASPAYLGEDPSKQAPPKTEVPSSETQANLKNYRDACESHREDIKETKTDADGTPADSTPHQQSKAAQDPEVSLKYPLISVERHESARGPVIFTRTGFVHLANGDCGDGVVNPYPDTVEDKYWAQRHRLFSRFEEGVQLDKEGWFSVTPEAIANHVAAKLVSSQPHGMIVLDAFCGVGGNAIAFALRKEVALVVCVDTDKARLGLAANNCKVYGIPKEKLLFVCADAATVLQCYQNGKRGDRPSNPGPSAQETDNADAGFCNHGYTFAVLDQIPSSVDAVFLSPPWGGSEYANQRHFDLESIRINDAVNGDDLFLLAVQSLSKDKLNMAYFVPRNTNGWRVGQCAYRAGLQYLEMEQNYLNNKLKTVTVYARNGASG